MAFPTGWGRTQAITIDNTKVSGTGSHSNYSMLITLDHLDAEIVDAGSNSALNGGGDIRFSSDSAGATQLAIEVVSFVTNATAGSRECEIWVKVPSVSTSADTDIYIWYKKSGEVQPAVTATYGRNAVWADEEVVLHMTNINAASVVDSTGNNTPTANGTWTASGANGLPFNGSTNYFNIPDSAGLDLSTTMSLRADCYSIGGTTNTWGMLISRGWFVSSHSNPWFNWALGIGTSNDALQTTVSSGSGSGRKTIEGSVDLRDGAQHYIAGTYDQTNVTNHVDGATDGSNAATITIANRSTSLTIGQRNAGSTGDWFTGTVKNVFIRAASAATLSAGWIATERNNQVFPATFATAGTPSTPVVSTGRIMSSLAAAGGLAYSGGIAGRGGGLAG